MTSIIDSVSVLRTKISNMNPKSRNFAQSLLNQYDRKGSLSPKQEYWVHKLAGNEGDERTKVHEKTAQVIELETYGPFLVKESSRQFASDLVKRWASHGNFSSKQQYWVDILIEKGKAGWLDAPSSTLFSDYDAVVELVARAGDTGTKALKEPRITLWGTANDGHTREVWVRTPGTKRKSDKEIPKGMLVVEIIHRAKNHASVNHKGHETTRGNPAEKQVAGYIHTATNEFQPSNRTVMDQHWVVDMLEDFKTDPIEKMAEMGRLAGRCAFCTRQLEDERSTAHGYGPVCAKNYQLPWSKGTAIEIIGQVEKKVNLKAVELVPGSWAVVDLDTNTIMFTCDSYEDAQRSMDEWSKVERVPSASQ